MYFYPEKYCAILEHVDDKMCTAAGKPSDTRFFRHIGWQTFASRDSSGKLFLLYFLHDVSTRWFQFDTNGIANGILNSSIIVRQKFSVASCSVCFRPQWNLKMRKQIKVTRLELLSTILCDSIPTSGRHLFLKKIFSLKTTLHDEHVTDETASSLGRKRNWVAHNFLGNVYNETFRHARTYIIDNIIVRFYLSQKVLFVVPFFRHFIQKP